MNRKHALIALIGWVIIQLAGVAHSLGHDIVHDHGKVDCAICDVMDRGGKDLIPQQSAHNAITPLTEQQAHAFLEVVLVRPRFWAPPPGRAPPVLT